MLDARITTDLLDHLHRQIELVGQLQRNLQEQTSVLHYRIGLVLDLAFAEIKVLDAQTNSGINVPVSSGEPSESADNQ